MRLLGTTPATQARNETVHLAHQLDLLDDRGLVDLQAAAIIVQFHPGDLADQGIGTPGGDFAQ